MSARWAVASRVLAAVAGGLLLALAACVCLALGLPDSRNSGVAIAAALVIPVWLTAMCFGFLSRSARRAWAGYLGSSGVLAATAWLLRSIR